ncbi:MAG: TfoX/Sxy family protein [Caulobacteraceae bacterium]|nr:TfoX/Sxy family protein [Caulobacteraceae bacterium]
MAYSAADGEWVQELLAGLGPLTLKKMFGAGAVYADGLMFAIVDDGVLWLRGDEGNIARMQAAGARQFTYPTKDGEHASLGYWSIPETAVDDPDEAVEWAREALDAARRKAAAKKPGKTKK